eukprot:Seg700.2 transcript_id=Seg700.2/GoldUCD/mRNA.D3Y31 product="Sodium/hydrogen exchanger 9B2" protein_id=Seg700.2/GoldUCD/D3Y31
MDLQAEYDGQPTEHSPLTRDKSIEESNHIEMVFASKKTGSNEECRGQLEIEKETSPAADEDTNDNEKQTNIDKRCKKCHIPKCLSPCLPPRGFFGDVLTRGLICFLAWATLWAILGKEALPGGNMYSLFILLVTASFAGFLVSTIPCVTFPPLLGMLIAGFLLRNVPGISVAKNINKQWSANLRNVALVVILLRSGLGLDIEALKRLKCTVIRLAFSPCLVEAITVGIVSHFLLGMPWLWAFMLGFILGAVSPAVVVPSMLNLQMAGYGTREGIPTLVMAASSCDDVLAISLFSVFLGIAFSQGNLVFNIFRGPLELCLGIFMGLVVGLLLSYIPNKNSKHAARNRSVLLVGFGLLSLFGSNRAELSGAGALGVLTLGAVAGYGWKDDGKRPIADVLSVLWEFFQPLLFGLIGAEVGLEYLSGELVGRGLATLAVGLVLRIAVTYAVVFGNKLSVKEKLFISLAWLPKATVQNVQMWTAVM